MCVPMARMNQEPPPWRSRSEEVDVNGRRYVEVWPQGVSFRQRRFQSYAQALRKITGDIVGETKREKRDAIKLRTLTPEKIETWRIEFIRRKATDPLKRRAPEFRPAASSCGRVRSSARDGWAGP